MNDAIKFFNEGLQYAPAYYWRGICRKNLDNDSQAQVDFAKAKEFGYGG